jgi:hypothetical protein
VWTNGAIAYDEEYRQVIIWGNKKQREGVGYVIHSCYRCGVTVHVVAEQKSKFTVYFIPVFTYSHKAFLFCSSCGAETELGGEEAKEALASAMPRFMLEALIAGMQDEEVARREDEIRTLASGQIAKKVKKTLAPARKAGVRAKAKKASPRAAKKAGPKKKGR